MNDDPIVVIAPSRPKYSEIWMQRMNQMLAPQLVFIALCDRDERALPNQGFESHTIRNRSWLPLRLALELNRKGLVKKVSKLLDQYRRGQTLTVMCHYLTTAVHLRELWQQPGLRCVVHCHGHDVTWDRRSELLPFLPAHGYRYQQHVSALVGKIELIANSHITRQVLLSAGFPRHDIHLKHLGIDSSAVETHFHRERRKLQVVFLGRMIDCKGPIETLRAFEKACDRGFKGSLHFAGDGPLRKPCQRLAKLSHHADNIQFYGAVSHDFAMQLLANGDICSAHNKRSPITGQEEAFGVSIIEAMAHGLPVVTGRSGGVVESIIHGKTGLLVTPGDVDAHADALLNLFEQPDQRSKMGKAARQRVVEHFDIKREQTQLKKILMPDHIPTIKPAAAPQDEFQLIRSA